MNSNNVGCEKILNLFRSELVTVNLRNSLENF